MKNCEWCNKIINKKGNIFCDLKCYQEWNKSFKVEKTCEVCFAKYYVPSCREKKSRCCSKECRIVIASAAAKEALTVPPGFVTLKCLHCQKHFKINKHKVSWQKNGTVGERKFCCKECQLQYRKSNLQRVKITCQQCGIEKEVKPYQSNSKYCSVKCKNEFQKTITGEKSPRFKHGFKIYRREALKLFEYKCSYCGLRHRRLHVHHIDGNNKNNIPSNWTILCEKHHRHLHSGLIELKPGS